MYSSPETSEDVWTRGFRIDLVRAAFSAFMRAASFSFCRRIACSSAGITFPAAIARIPWDKTRAGTNQQHEDSRKSAISSASEIINQKIKRNVQQFSLHHLLRPSSGWFDLICLPTFLAVPNCCRVHKFELLWVLHHCTTIVSDVLHCLEWITTSWRSQIV